MKLGFNGTASTSGRSDSPFWAFLTDDGTDTSLNENYASATDAYWTAPADAIVTVMTIVVGESDPAQSATLNGTFVFTTALTNGLKFAIKNSAGTVVSDLSVTYPIKTTAGLLAFATSTEMTLQLPSSTAANNELMIGCYVDFSKKFGRPLFVPRNHSIVCTLEDNLSSLDEFTIGVAGHYE